MGDQYSHEFCAGFGFVGLFEVGFLSMRELLRRYELQMAKLGEAGSKMVLDYARWVWQKMACSFSELSDSIYRW